MNEESPAIGEKLRHIPQKKAWTKPRQNTRTACVPACRLTVSATCGKRLAAATAELAIDALDAEVPAQTAGHLVRAQAFAWPPASSSRT